jgi:hypothetical protein
MQLAVQKCRAIHTEKQFAGRKANCSVNVEETHYLFWQEQLNGSA